MSRASEGGWVEERHATERATRQGVERSGIYIPLDECETNKENDERGQFDELKEFSFCRFFFGKTKRRSED